MNNVTDLILTLSKNNVRIKLSDNDELVVNAPKGFWNDNPELFISMKSNKDNIKIQLAAKSEQKELEIVHRSEFDSLSYSQARMWFHQLVHESNSSYNMPICFRLAGDIEMLKLKKNIITLINQHESLRMGFKSILGEPKQFILKKTDMYDVLVEKSCNDENEAKKVIAKFIKKPFVLDKPPLFRVLLLHVDEKVSFLTFCFHHIISDGVGINLFLNNLISSYHDVTALNRNQLDYCDYANWHNKWLNSSLAENQLQYWKNRLQHNTIEAGDLKGDKPRPLSITFDVITDTFSLPKHIASNLKDFCTQHRYTLYSALLAIYVRLSCEYNDRNFLIVGTPVSGRTKAQFDNVIGLFVNTLPLCIEYRKEESYKSFCTHLTNQLAADFNYQDFPFDKIVNSLGIKRDISRNPLFQTMFLLEHKNDHDLNFSGTNMAPYPVDLGFGQFDLTVGVSVSTENIDISIEYNHKIYSKEWISSFKNNFIFLLETLLKNPDEPLRNFSVSSPSEIKKLILFGGLNEKNFDNKIINIVTLIEKNAQNYVEKIAVQDIYSTYTYHELSAYSDNIAKTLIKIGVKPGALIAIKMSRSKELIATMLGIWKANATYLPIDPKSPIKRTEYVLKDSGCSWMIMNDITEIPNSPKIHYLSFHDIAQKNNDDNVLRPDEEAYPAYVIYTSGTTGLPKGVVVNHHGLQNLVRIYKETYSLTPDDKCSQFATQAFDVFACEVWPALSIGASIYIVDEDTKLSPSDTIAFFQKNEITVCDIPTVIAQEIWNESEFLSKMRLMKIGGEKITKYPPLHLPYLVVNSYGPTENTVESTYAFLNADLHDGKQSIVQHILPPIGKPFPGIKSVVLNQENKLVPICAPGELILLGDGLADGYLNNPELTNEKFIEFSLCDEIQKIRGYKTGDIVSWQHDGQLQFIGRKDKQVKVRNFRIEISEIEHAISQIEGLSNVVVTTYGEKVEEKIIVAFVILKNIELSSTSIKLILKDFLPDYMIPAKIINIKEIPLTLNGKVDYDSLLLLVKDGIHYTAQNYITPKTHLEITLAEIWSEVLKVKRVGVYDNFFDIGGDSLSSIRISALAKRKGLSLKPLHLHQYKTISEITQKVELLAEHAASTDEVKNISRLSPIQNWFISQKFSKPEHYNQSLLFVAPNFFDNQIAKQLLKWILHQHSILKMRLSLDKKNYIINNNVNEDDYLFELVINQNENITSAIENISSKVQSQFDLYTGPLFKVFYIHDELERVKRICIVAHHLLIDVASWSILIDDINYFLSQSDTVFTNIDFLPKTTSYAKWIDAVKKLKVNKSSALLLHADESNDYKKSDLAFEKSKTHIISFDNNFFSSLKNHEFVLLLCAQYIGDILQKSIVLAENESHGRFESLVDDCDLTRTVGWFTVIYPITINTSSILKSKESILKAQKITDKDKINFLLNKQYKNIIFDLSFNFHGNVRKNDNAQNNILVPAPEKITGTISPFNHRSAIFDVNAYIDEDGLKIEMTIPAALESKIGGEDQMRKKMGQIMKELL